MQYAANVTQERHIEQHLNATAVFFDHLVRRLQDINTSGVLRTRANGVMTRSMVDRSLKTDSTFIRCIDEPFHRKRLGEPFWQAHAPQWLLASNVSDLRRMRAVYQAHYRAMPPMFTR